MTFLCWDVALVRVQFLRTPASLRNVTLPYLPWTVTVDSKMPCPSPRRRPFCALLILALRILLTHASSAGYNTTHAASLADSQTLSHPFPYFFPSQHASPAQLFAMPSCQGFDIEDATIDELQTYMASGKLSSVILVTCYMQRAFHTGEYIK